MGKGKRQSLRDLARDLVQEAEAKYPEAIAAKRAANSLPRRGVASEHFDGQGQENELTEFERDRRHAKLVSDGEVVQGSYELTTAQEIMRADMLRPARKSMIYEPGHVMQSGRTVEQVNMVRRAEGTPLLKIRGVTDEPLSLLENGVKLDKALSELLGQESESDKAHSIINDEAPHLVLGFKEWAVVTKLIESGIALGYAEGFQAGLTDV